MRTLKAIFILLAMGALILFMSQPVLAGSACAIPEVDACLFSQLDEKAKGTKVFCTLTAYYEPAGSLATVTECPDCTDPKGYLNVFIRAGSTKGGWHHFLMRVSTESLTPNGADPCLAFTEVAKCQCRRDIAIDNGLEFVPLCTVADQAFQEELFLEFIRANIIPELFPDSPEALFAVKSVSDYTIEEDVEPFYGIMDFVLAVQE